MTKIQKGDRNNSRFPSTINMQPKISYREGHQLAKQPPSKCRNAKSIPKFTSLSSSTPLTSTSFSTLGLATKTQPASFPNNGRSDKRTNTEAPQCRSTQILITKALPHTTIKPPSSRRLWSCASRTIRITKVAQMKIIMECRTSVRADKAKTLIIPTRSVSHGNGQLSIPMLIANLL